MMPSVLDLHKGLISRKSATENARDFERCVAAVHSAAATHNQVLKEHGIPKRYEVQPRFQPMPGNIVLAWMGIRSDLIKSKPEPDDNAYDVAGCLAAQVHALAEHNLVLLEHHPQIPELLQSGVRYRTDPNAWKVQTLKSIPTIKKQGGSDCKCLVGWALAHKWRDELARLGKRLSRCKIYWRFLGIDKLLELLPEDMLREFLERLPEAGPIPQGRLFHAEMRSPDSPHGYTTPDGEVQDVSRLLGM